MHQVTQYSTFTCASLCHVMQELGLRISWHPSLCHHFLPLDTRHIPLPPPDKNLSPPRGTDIPIPDIVFWKSKDLFCLLVPWRHLYPGKAEQKCLVTMTWQEQPVHSHHSWKPVLRPISLTEDPQFEGESYKSSSPSQMLPAPAEVVSKGPGLTIWDIWAASLWWKSRRRKIQRQRRFYSIIVKMFLIINQSASPDW